MFERDDALQELAEEERTIPEESSVQLKRESKVESHTLLANETPFQKVNKRATI